MLGYKRLLIQFILILFICFVHTFRSYAAEKDSEYESADSTFKNEQFNPGTFMFSHVEDSHEWEIIEWHGHQIRIPLPVILYSKYKGINIFMSSKFENESAEYNGFKLIAEGENKGGIIEIMPDGSIYKPLDLSITKNIFSLFLGTILLLWLFISIGNAYKRNPNKPPKGMQSLLEPVIIFVREDIAKPSIGETQYERFMPYLLTLFFFIWLNNILGLVPFFPGGANLTGNIAVTGVMALFTFVITTVNGSKTYWKHIVNPPDVPIWMKLPIPIIPFIEATGIFTKPFVLMIRLFANITAGHFVAAGFISLIYIFAHMNVILGYGMSVFSVAFDVFLIFMELLVGFIQAYVFTFLSALYFGMAMEKAH